MVGQDARSSRVGLSQGEFGRSKGFPQPEHHWGALKLVVDELAAMPGVGPTAIDAGSVIFFQPAHPVLFLAGIPSGSKTDANA